MGILILHVILIAYQSKQTGWRGAHILNDRETLRSRRTTLPDEVINLRTLPDEVINLRKSTRQQFNKISGSYIYYKLRLEILSASREVTQIGYIIY